MARPNRSEQNRVAIVAEALALLDAEGPSGLSMRRLAARLGMQGPSLYHYFATKEAILDAINDHISEAIDPGEHAAWPDSLRAFGHAYRSVIARHPHAVALLVARPVTSSANPGTLRLYERQLARLISFGWALPFAWWTVMAIEALVLGDALQAGAPDLEIDEDDVRSEFPLVARVADELRPRAGDPASFELGLEGLIAGVARRLDPQ